MIKVGDEVKVVRWIADHSDGWDNVWAVEMDSYIGSKDTFTVASVNKSGVFFREDGGTYGFPPGALELVSDPNEVATRLLYRVAEVAFDAARQKKGERLSPSVIVHQAMQLERMALQRDTHTK
jgi:hypothetical protein